MENNTVEIARRDTLEKQTISFDNLDQYIEQLLEDIQNNIFNKALQFREETTRKADTWEQFTQLLDQGGFVAAHWDGTPETEEKIKEETKATIRCIPLNNTLEEGKCIYSGKPSRQRVLFAVAY